MRDRTVLQQQALTLHADPLPNPWPSTLIFCEGSALAWFEFIYANPGEVTTHNEPEFNAIGNPKTYPRPRLQDHPSWRETLKTREIEEQPGGRNWGGEKLLAAR